MSYKSIAILNKKNRKQPSGGVLSGSKISITFEFKDILPDLLRLDRIDLVDEMIDLLGEWNKNHLDLFLKSNNEYLVM